jgi:hypothetical protein
LRVYGVMHQEIERVGKVSERHLSDLMGIISAQWDLHPDEITRGSLLSLFSLSLHRDVRMVTSLIPIGVYALSCGGELMVERSLELLKELIRGCGELSIYPRDLHALFPLLCSLSEKTLEHIQITMEIVAIYISVGGRLWWGDHGGVYCALLGRCVGIVRSSVERSLLEGLISVLGALSEGDMGCLMPVLGEMLSLTLQRARGGEGDDVIVVYGYMTALCQVCIQSGDFFWRLFPGLETVAEWLDYLLGEFFRNAHGCVGRGELGVWVEASMLLVGEEGLVERIGRVLEMAVEVVDIDPSTGRPLKEMVARYFEEIGRKMGGDLFAKVVENVDRTVWGKMGM